MTDAHIRVLLVDDEVDFVQTLAERLEMRGLACEVAFEAVDALVHVARCAPHVMVTDLRMPGMDGLELVERLRGVAPGVATIMLTGHGSDVDAEAARALGVFAYLRKPAPIATLVETIERAHAHARDHGSPS